MKFHIRGYKNIFLSFMEKMTSRDTDDVIPGKINDLTRTAKSGVNIIAFLSKFQKVFIFVRVVVV